MKNWIPLCLFLLIACSNPKSSDGNGGDNNTGQSAFLATCLLTDNQNHALACVDYVTATGHESDCINQRNHYAAEGASQYQFMAITSSGATTSCRLTTSSIPVGSCSFADHTTRYYSATWYNLVGQNDCQSLGGSWSQ